MSQHSQIVLTGDRPTGPLHLGHYVGSLASRITYQNTHQLFILIADTQVMNNDFKKIKEVNQNILEVMKDYLSLGLSPEKINFFQQSKILQLFELSNYISNLVTLPQVMRNPTIRAENESYNNSISMGFLNYPVSQTADMILFNADLIPVGEDQVPIIEFANDLVSKINFHLEYECFKHLKPVLTTNSRLNGIDGKGKMSKSLGNAIYLKDNEATVNSKVYQMYTDPNHIKVSDPGNIEGNVVFQFLDAFHKDSLEVEELKLHYQKGGLGDVKLKKMLMADLKEFMDPIREARTAITDEYALDVLNYGTEQCKLIAKNNMEKFRKLLFR